MVRTMFVNPFKKHHVDEFPDVLVPLDDASHRNAAAAPRASLPTSHDPKSEKDDKDHDPSNTLNRPDSNASSGVVNSGMTLAALKAEIEADVAASDTDTPYDRGSSPYTTVILAFYY